MKDLSIKKLYYSISEVSKITEVEQYVLRYWETEFERLQPQKNRAGNRIYTNKDISQILKIKELLREKRYTIEGAKHILENYSEEDEKEIKTNGEEAQKENAEKKEIANAELKNDLEEIRKTLQLLLNKL
jgi:DNA-binding transcriptional MerR regulator